MEFALLSSFVVGGFYDTEAGAAASRRAALPAAEAARTRRSRRAVAETPNLGHDPPSACR